MRWRGVDWWVWVEDPEGQDVGVSPETAQAYQRALEQFLQALDAFEAEMEEPES